jgi:DNA polymerase-1
MNLYLDGDIIAYTAAASAEKPIDWGDGFWTLHAFEDDVKYAVDRYVDNLLGDLEFDEVRVALSDTRNFRKGVASYYKENRKDTRKPMLLQFAKDYMYEKYDGIIYPNLEADDVLGILVTSSLNNVIWSADKDLKTCPGRHLINEEIVEIQEIEADYWFYTQVLTGDATDNYAGCPKVGPKTADKILQQEGEWWDLVVGAYTKAGLGEEMALENARLARILHNGEYDLETGEVTLWTPKMQ